MKKKTINAIISKKMNNWLKSIEDEALRDNVKKAIIVTGGCITSMLLNEPVNDFDVYLKDKETLKALSEYYCKKFNEKNGNKGNAVGRVLHAWVLDGQDVEDWKNDRKKLNSFAFDYPDYKYKDLASWSFTSADDTDLKFRKRVSSMLTNITPDRIKIMINSDGVAEDSDHKADEADYDINKYLEAVADGDEVEDKALEDEKGKYVPIFLSTNAITLSNAVQIIVRFYGEPDKIHENYDFVHATNYWTFGTGCVLNQPALEAILNKELFYVGSKYPVCSLIRTRKFIKRGWQINAGQFVKMSFQISELDLTDVNVLEDQLVGVDSIYFLNFIKALQEKTAFNKDFKLTSQYLTTVIDKIFG